MTLAGLVLRKTTLPIGIVDSMGGSTLETFPSRTEREGNSGFEEGRVARRELSVFCNPSFATRNSLAPHRQAVASPVELQKTAGSGCAASTDVLQSTLSFGNLVGR